MPDIPPLACKIAIALAEQIRELEAQIAMIEGEIKTWFRGNDLAKRLATIPGIGFITASALAASVAEDCSFNVGAVTATASFRFSEWMAR